MSEGMYPAAIITIMVYEGLQTSSIPSRDERPAVLVAAAAIGQQMRVNDRPCLQLMQ